MGGICHIAPALNGVLSAQNGTEQIRGCKLRRHIVCHPSKDDGVPFLEKGAER